MVPNLRYYNERPKKTDVKVRGFHVNKTQRGSNEQQESKECKTRKQEVNNTITIQSGKTLMKLVWKIREVVRDKGPLSKLI